MKGPIILIDDDEDDQYLIELSLKALKLVNEIKKFENGEEALHYLSTTEDQPSLILCDINMPVMNGLELCRHLNDNEQLREKAVPFVFLTTAANAQLVKEAYKNTVQGFFKKAADYTTLEKQISSIVDYWQTCLHPNSH